MSNKGRSTRGSSAKRTPSTQPAPPRASQRRSLFIAFSLTFLGVIGAYTVPFMLGPPAPEMMGVFISAHSETFKTRTARRCRRWC